MATVGIVLKKIVLILFVVFSLFSSANVEMPSNVSHSHIHANEMGVEHSHEHSHIEISNSLFFYSFDNREFLDLKVSKVENKTILNSKLIINSIFRPPIKV